MNHISKTVELTEVEAVFIADLAQSQLKLLQKRLVMGHDLPKKKAIEKIFKSILKKVSPSIGIKKLEVRN